MAKSSILLGIVPLLLGMAWYHDFAISARRTLTVLGVFRSPSSTYIASEEDLVVIDQTTHCEDLHYHAPSGLLFTACEASEDVRYSWFPPLVNFDNPTVTRMSRGSIHIIDPKIMKAQKLELVDFEGPFVTHGIDVIPDPARKEGEAVYVFAVNHIPNEAYYGQYYNTTPQNTSPSTFKSRSRVEIFHYTIGSDAARHIRSVWHPLLRTPNDIAAISPTSFFITNDHHYFESVMRQIEDIYFPARWTESVHVQLSRLEEATDDMDGVKASVALEKMHNNNGIGHGCRPGEIILVNTVSAVLNLARVNGTRLVIEHSIEVDGVIDNPSYFADPFADDDHDASMYIVAGLARAIELHGNIRNTEAKDPVMIWGVKLVSTPHGGVTWTKRLLFEDDSSRIRTSSAAVLIAIDPAEEGGRRRGWLFVTGFLSRNAVAIKIDL